jgi:hypothetical protein
MSLTQVISLPDLSGRSLTAAGAKARTPVAYGAEYERPFNRGVAGNAPSHGGRGGELKQAVSFRNHLG